MASAAPAAFCYMGPIFRQRLTGAAEFDQAGLELLAQHDGDVALDQVLTFARAALSIYNVVPDVRLGGVGLFEALLVQADMPDAWRSARAGTLRPHRGARSPADAPGERW